MAKLGLVIDDWVASYYVQGHHRACRGVLVFLFVLPQTSRATLLSCRPIDVLPPVVHGEGSDRIENGNLFLAARMLLGQRWLCTSASFPSVDHPPLPESVSSSSSASDLVLPFAFFTHYRYIPSPYPGRQDSAEPYHRSESSAIITLHRLLLR